MENKCVICDKDLQGNQKKYCSGACKQKAHWNSFKTQQNSYHSQTIRALERKMKFANLLGGKCSVCGYDKNIAALEFNHIIPSEKSFALDARKFSNTNEKDLEIEVLKCNLLCSNCHKEHHYPEMEINNVKVILDNKYNNK